MNLGYKIHLEYDSQPIADALETATVENLKRLGVYVRHSIRSVLRYSRRTSRPGEPPSLHKSKTQTTSPLLRGLVFAMPDSMTVNIGITAAAGKSGQVARTLEEGGLSVTSKGDRVSIAPRPFMRPAFKVEAMKAPEMWAGSISS